MVDDFELFRQVVHKVLVLGHKLYHFDLCLLLGLLYKRRLVQQVVNVLL